MPRLHTPSNPFMLMMDPQAVIDSMEHSELLARLHSRICRPLDRVQMRAGAAADMAAHDRLIDDELDDE